MQTKTDIIGMLNMVVSNEKGFRLSVDGDISEYKFDGETYDIQKIKDLCNFDYIEIVPLNDGIILVCDEEGLLKGEPKVNTIATKLYQSAYGTDQVGIVGDCVICNTKAVK